MNTGNTDQKKQNSPAAATIGAVAGLGASGLVVDRNMKNKIKLPAQPYAAPMLDNSLGFHPQKRAEMRAICEAEEKELLAKFRKTEGLLGKGFKKLSNGGKVGVVLGVLGPAIAGAVVFNSIFSRGRHSDHESKQQMQLDQNTQYTR